MKSYRFNIRSKLIFSLTVLALVIISIATLFTYFRTHKAIQAEIQKNGIMLIKVFTQMVAGRIVELDYITVLEDAYGLMKDSDIQSIEIINKEGKIWISTNRNQIDPIPMIQCYKDILKDQQIKYRKVQRNAKWQLQFISPITTLGRVTHFVIIEVSLESMEQQLAQETLSIFLLSCAMIGIAALLAVALSKLLTAPIRNLVSGTHEISQGNYDYRINEYSQDEIGELSQSFNRMADNLQTELSKRAQVEKELKKHRDQLGELVKERTAELEETNQELGHEINVRMQSEEALLESEERYRDLFENADNLIQCIQPDGSFLYVNPAWRKALGYGADEIAGISIFDIIHPGHRDHNTDIFRRVKAGEDISSIETAYISKTGQTIMIEGSCSCLMKDGQTAAIRGIYQDITERKRIEKALRKSEERLVRSKKMESLGLLAGGVAHDLNNVLSGIVSYPELLLLDLPESSNLRKPIETIQASGLRANAIVQDLLTVARGVAINREPLDLNDLIDNYLHSPEFNKLKQFHPTVRVDIDLSSKLLNISGSPIHIRKVLMNLVSNAAEAVESNGRVTITTQNCYMDRPLKGYNNVSIGEYVLLTVSDDGSGIASDDLERIFEPFYTKKFLGRSGTGLGLAVVWNIVLDHKGYIDVKSNDIGTTFELYFPITREEISNEDLPMAIEDYKGNGETILVVDDLESQRDISCNILDALGYQARAVSSGEEAVEYLKKNRVDLLLLDMIMDPGMNGHETYKRILKYHPRQKAIIASGFAETDDMKETQKLGAGPYIKKPITIEKLGLAIKEELGK